MKIWATADLHLAITLPHKSMHLLDSKWEGYHERIANFWRENVAHDDLVLIAGDISWAKTAEDAAKDLNWIAQLPGKKIISKGNHDPWWQSQQKVLDILPPHFIALDAAAILVESDIAIAAVRLWEDPLIDYNQCIDWKDNPRQTKKEPFTDEELVKKRSHDSTIFQRELIRLKIALDQLQSIYNRSEGKVCSILMCHYPPIGPDFQTNPAFELIEKYPFINHVIFGDRKSVV